MSGDGRFEGMVRLVGRRGAEALQSAHVCVIGLGGVGSWTVEALARSGVGALTLVDLDEICVTNANRQLHTLSSTVGQLKADVMAERVQQINPECHVRTIPDFYTHETADEVLDTNYDYVVDAIDVPPLKALLVAQCRDRGMPVVVVGGAGGRVDPSKIVTGDLNMSRNDGLLRRVRKALRKDHGFKRTKNRWRVPAIFSDEPPVFPTGDGGIADRPTPGRDPIRLDCATGYGAGTFVTGSFGFAAAAVVVQAIVAKAQPPAS
ncbi:MAG: tRNA A37 threonylcarbamoyladenosine dehydratase [Myxococcota bacterium]|jgi:tRNA A37 threonylcarbamoyladenosine dehydratase